MKQSSSYVPDEGVFTRLREAARELATVSDDELLAGLGAALALWKGPRGIGAAAALEISGLTGMNEAMLAFGLRRTISAHSRARLARWLTEARAEAGAETRLGRGVARRGTARAPAPRAAGGAAPCGPEVVAQILAGNVAGLAIPAALEALLARSAVILKPAEEEPVTARLFKESLDRAAPVLGRAVAVVQWKGGDEAVEREIFAKAGLVVASGGAEMVRSVTARAGRTSGRQPPPLLVYGPRISIGLVGGGWLDASPAWWSTITREIVLWEQAGCLSPRILFVVGDRRRFAARLAEALARWERRWPSPPRTAAQTSAILAHRARYEMGDGRPRGIIAPAAPTWSVVWDDAPSVHPGPAARVVRVTALARPRELGELFAAHRDEVQGIGYACLGNRTGTYTNVARDAGVAFVAPLESIQDPPAGWRADGRSGLAELLRRGR
jgi:hypothetical protein